MISATTFKHSKFFIGLGELISPNISVNTGLIYLLCINYNKYPFSSIVIVSDFSNNFFIWSYNNFLSDANDSLFNTSKSCKKDYSSVDWFTNEFEN